MSPPLVLLTGFGPFVDVDLNPSGEVVRSLVAEPPDGVELAGGVLPVSVERVPAAYDALLEAAPRAPDVLLALGVHPGPEFRLERRARVELTSAKLDNDGRAVAGIRLEGEPERATTLELERLESALREAGAKTTRISDDAGGFVCERTYHHVLGCAHELGVPGLFLHVPPAAEMGVEEQRGVVARFLLALGELK